ncbi:MAG: putative repeat protein (TIGR01451 family) [Sulfitobacter sp.]|jgi:uncharacterized repeat protein (TIGR01451 family)
MRRAPARLLRKPRTTNSVPNQKADEVFKHVSKRLLRHLCGCTAAIAALAASELQAGDFTLDWGQIDWPAGSTAPLTTTLTDQYGFEIDATVNVAGAFTTGGGIVSPDDTSLLGGSVPSLGLVSDAPANLGRVGDATVSAQLTFSSNSFAFPVDGLVLDILDVDAGDTNAPSDSCDFITVTGTNGDPTLSAVSSTPTFVLGPGAGSGLTGPLAANQAQCIFVDGLAGSPTSANTDTGTVRATFPDGTASVTAVFDESIGNVRTSLGYDAAARDIGVLAASSFSVGQGISLVKTSEPNELPEPGTTITYTYFVTNDGALPFNVGQDIVIVDDSVATVTCPAITAEVPVGGTLECTAEYTVTVVDVLSGSLTSTATAGIGPIGQTFDDRLQSNAETLTLLYALGYDFGDAPLTYLVPSHAIVTAPTIYLGTVAPDAETFAQPDTTATGDDLSNSDDEDGVTLPLLTQGTIVTITVNVAGDGFLQAWMDFDGNGLFANDALERLATDLRDDGLGDDIAAGDGEIQIRITVPDDATTSLTFGRFRWASEAGLGISGATLDGEVEDYSFVIAAADLVDRGDAPASYGDPRHVVVPTIYLGSGSPDLDISAKYSAGADGDDLDGIDDEDATSFPPLVAGTTVPLTVLTHETQSFLFDLGLPVLVPGITNLQVWVDFDQNGTFDPTEQVAVNYRDGGTGDTDGRFNNQITLNIPVPADAIAGPTYARLRWSTTSGLITDPFDGLNLDGEVEDYLVTVINPNGPLTCSSNFYMVATEPGQNLPALDELSISESGGVYTLTHVDLPPNYTGNFLVTGWGYNELDGFIYGVRQSPRSLMRIDASGAVTEVADLSALSIESPDTSSDILPNGIMIYMSGSDSSRYQLLDISDPANPVALGVLTASAGATYSRDMAYNPLDGLIYFFDTSRNLHFFDPNNGVPGSTTVGLLANVPLAEGKFSMDIDSVWFDGSGYMYGFDNQSRQVFAVEVGAEGNRPASYEFIEVQGTVDNMTYQGNDGASCRAPGPFVSSVLQEGAISGTLYEDTNNSGTLDAGETGLPAGITVTLFDDNGTPADPADDTLALTVETAADGTYLFGSVNSTLTYRIEVDETDPEIPAELDLSTANPLTGVAVVTNADTSDQNFGFVIAPSVADLSLTKSALSAADGLSVTQATAGEALDFVLTVTNDGPGDVTGVQVRDLMPDGFAYVSDDAVAQGDTYDTGTGIWAVEALANGASAVLTIRVTMRDSGEHTNTAEIVASSLPDPDSDVAVGALVDDQSDGLADDDEASVSVAYAGTGATLSGVVFLDNGAGATAYDGVQGGGETGTNRALIQITDSAGELIGSPAVAADGSWSLTLPNTYTDAVTITVLPDQGHRPVSETAAALPGIVNADPRDGTLTFTPAAGTSYSDLNFGLIVEARLNLDQQAAIRPGQVVSLRHEYIADATGTVTFTVDAETSATPAAFSTALFLDTDCDGTADAPVNGPIAIEAGTVLCILARVSSSSAASPGASYSFELVADTSYGTSGLSEQDRNTDRVTVESSQGAIKLTKTVRNVTQGTAEGVTNGAAVGDILEYRIYVRNTGTLPSSDLIIYDRTPPYTVLATAVPSPVSLGSDVTCSSSTSGSDSAGYAGNLRWDCTGLFQPGDEGSVTFEVRVSP